MNEELDSQLSAMFDDELPQAQCELLARRLSRDEALKARWGRYAVMGAVIRAERGVRLNAPLAGRVSAVLLAEPELGGAPAPPEPRGGGVRWWQPVAATAVAVSVATAAIVWLRTQSPLAGGAFTAPQTAMSASGPASASLPATAAAERIDSYVVPRSSARAIVVPSTELANYVVAHSMFSSPVARRNLLAAFVASESATPVEEPQDDAKSGAQ